MTFAETFAAELHQPFRIALIIGLIYTTYKNRAVTGLLIPLAAGAVFVAALLPMTMGAQDPAPFWDKFGIGLAANLVLITLFTGLWEIWRRLRR